MSIKEEILEYLKKCDRPVTRYDIEMSIARISAGAVCRHTGRALARLCADGKVFIVPIRVRGRARRGFVAVGSPAAAHLPQSAPRFTEYVTALSFVEQ